MTPTRRTVLALLPAALLTACTTPSGADPGDGATQVEPVEPSTAAPGPASGSDAPRLSLDPVEPWREPPGEAHLAIKRAATDAVEAIGGWTDRAGATADAARARGASLELPAEVVDTFAELLEPEAVAATIEVVYPQIGGLTSSEASVMTVVSQRLLLRDGTRDERGNVLDIRLARQGKSWVVQGVTPTAPLPSAGGPLSEPAQRVLDHPRLVLPPSAAADVRTGAIDDSILAVLAGLADEHDLQVQVFYDGHPTNVFGTDRVSRHSQGRAVDLVRVDGVMVTDPAMPRETLEAVMTLAGKLGATEVGGPFDLNGPARGYFTDAVHLDHLHVAVGLGVPPAVP